MSDKLQVFKGHLERSGRSGQPEAVNELAEFDKWWIEYVKTLNARATLVWQEIAWAGWFARSEIAEGKEPSIFPRRGPSE